MATSTQNTPAGLNVTTPTPRVTAFTTYYKRTTSINLFDNQPTSTRTNLNRVLISPSQTFPSTKRQLQSAHHWASQTTFHSTAHFQLTLPRKLSPHFNVLAGNGHGRAAGLKTSNNISHALNFYLITLICTPVMRSGNIGLLNCCTMPACSAHRLPLHNTRHPISAQAFRDRG